MDIGYSNIKGPSDGLTAGYDWRIVLPKVIACPCLIQIYSETCKVGLKKLNTAKQPSLF